MQCGTACDQRHSTAPVPVIILARLAVNLQHQCAGLDKALLKDALLHTAQSADIAGIRALLVHAKDEPARQWYLNWEFEPSPSDPFHMFILMKDTKATVGSMTMASWISICSRP